MVYHNHEHGRRLNPPASTPLPRALAQHHLHHLLRPQRRFVLIIHIHFNFALHPLSAAIPRRVATPPPELVPCDIPDWACNDHQYDYIGVCAFLGPRYGDLCMGAVVDR